MPACQTERMRRVIRSVPIVAAVCLSLSFGGVAAYAAPSPTPEAPTATKGKKVCTIKDPRLVEISGLVATESGYVVVNDSSDVESRRKVFFLNKKCGVDEAISYSGTPRDPEDLAISPDGTTLYIADIGDNPTAKERRSTVALWTMPVDGSKKPVVHRLTYPDGPHDAEALLFNGDGTPIIVTKDAGKSALYMPTGPLQPETREGVPMQKVGEVEIPSTNTEHVLGAAARMLVTGGANAPDGSRVVLRTYTDAFEWDVSDGDVVKALTTGTPRVTPLPDEPMGEAISYTPDGKLFVTVSETEHLDDVDPVILSYQPSTQAATKQVAGGGAADKAAGPSLLDRLGIRGITYLIAAVGVLGAVMVGAGVFGILRARRKKRTSVDDDESQAGRVATARASVYGEGGDAIVAPAPAASTVAQPSTTGRVYGGRPGHQGGGSVYGGRASGGSVYGGSGGVYGGPAAGSVYGGGSSGAEYRGGEYGNDRGAHGWGGHAGDRDGYGYR